MYARFTLSLRDVEELLAERGLDVSYETVRRWFMHFGGVYARRIRQDRHKPTDHWFLDEMVVVIRGQKFYLWRAVDSEGEVLDFLVQRRRNTRAAARLMRKLLKKTGIAPAIMVTDKLGSYGAAKTKLGLSAVHEQGMRKNNRCEGSHLPVRRRERKMQRFKSPGSAQRFLNVHANVYYHFTIQRHLLTRPTMKELREQAFQQWRTLPQLHKLPRRQTCASALINVTTPAQHCTPASSAPSISPWKYDVDAHHGICTAWDRTRSWKKGDVTYHLTLYADNSLDRWNNADDHSCLWKDTAIGARRIGRVCRTAGVTIMVAKPLAKQDPAIEDDGERAATTNSTYASRARFFDSGNAFNLKYPAVPCHQFMAERDRALDPATGTALIPLDLSDRLDIPYPVTTPLILTCYARIRAGDRLETKFTASGELYYVIEGAGHSTKGADRIDWASGDIFCLPGGGETVHVAGDDDCVLWVITNEPALAFEHLRPAHTDDAVTEAVHYPAAEIDHQLARVRSEIEGEDIAGLALIFSHER